MMIVIFINRGQVTRADLVDDAVEAFGSGYLEQAAELAGKSLVNEPNGPQNKLARWIIDASDSIRKKDGKLVCEIGGHYYAVVSHPSDQPNAQKMCVSLGGRLGVCATESDYRELMKNPMFIGKPNGYRYWLGGSLKTTKVKETFRWADGSKLTYDLWWPGEPSGNGVVVDLWNRNGVWKMDDTPSNLQKFFLIEWVRLPEPDLFAPVFLSDKPEVEDARFTKLYYATKASWETKAAGFRAKLARLNESYKGALGKALAAAKSAKKTAEIESLEAEIAVVKPDQPCHHAVGETRYGALVKLADVYDKSFEKMRAELDVVRASMCADYVKRLQELAKTMEAEKSDDAKVVFDLCERLGKASAPADAKTSDAKGADDTPADIREHMRIAAEMKPGSIREICQMFIRVGGWVELTNGKTTFRVTDAKQIPEKERGLAVRAVGAGAGSKYKSAPLLQEEFDKLCHLNSLVSVSLLNVGVTNANMRFLSTCPSIEDLVLHGAAFDDNGLYYVQHCQNLWKLNLVYSKVTGSGFRCLDSKAKIRYVDLRAANSVDEALPALGQMPELEHLNLQVGSVSGKNLHYLSSCGKLRYLDVASTLVRAEDLGPLKALSIEFLSISFSKDRPADAQCQMMASCMPNLKTFCFPDHGSECLEQVTALAHAFPKLTGLDLHRTTFEDNLMLGITGFENLISLNLNGTPVTDEGMAYVAKLPKLENLDISWTPITGAGLQSLGKMRKLKQVAIKGCQEIKESDLLEFIKKNRMLKIIQ